MNDRTLHDIDRYVTTTNALISSGGFTYRGQCCSSWSLEPGIIRRIKKTYAGIGESGLLFSLSVHHTSELLRTARANGYFETNECDLNVLAVLQHYGAATPLLDFSNDPLVALYFACQPYEEDNVECDGKVFCINYPDQVRSYSSPMRPVSDPSRMDIESALGPDGHPGIWYWEAPDDLGCKRSERQRSVFVFGWGLYWTYNTDKLIDELKVLVIPAESKRSILKELEERCDISSQTLFPDIHGFAQSHSHDKLIRYLSAREFYDKGEELWWDGSPEWAAEYYKMAYTKKPDWIDARYRCALALSANGDKDEALASIGESVRRLGEKWEFVACKAIINQRLDRDWKTDLKKAEEIANSVDESLKFKNLVSNHAIVDP